MFKLVKLTALALLLLTGSGLAKTEVQRTVTVWEISDFPDLEASAKAVCASKAVLSAKLQTACKTGVWPSVTKAGHFRNTGIGAELNTLINQPQ